MSKTYLIEHEAECGCCTQRELIPNVDDVEIVHKKAKAIAEEHGVRVEIFKLDYQGFYEVPKPQAKFTSSRSNVNGEPAKL